MIPTFTIARVWLQVTPSFHPCSFRAIHIQQGEIFIFSIISFSSLFINIHNSFQHKTHRPQSFITGILFQLRLIPSHIHLRQFQLRCLHIKILHADLIQLRIPCQLLKPLRRNRKRHRDPHNTMPHHIPLCRPCLRLTAGICFHILQLHLIRIRKRQVLPVKHKILKKAILSTSAPQTHSLLSRHDHFIQQLVSQINRNHQIPLLSLLITSTSFNADTMPAGSAPPDTPHRSSPAVCHSHLRRNYHIRSHTVHSSLHQTPALLNPLSQTAHKVRHPALKIRQRSFIRH